MDNATGHTTSTPGRSRRSSVKICLLPVFALLLLVPVLLRAQVVNNVGAYVSVTNGAVVDGGDVENNNVGTIKNDGTINLKGDYTNDATTRGNGYYNIKGDWVNRGLFDPDTSTVQLYGSTPQNVINPPGDDFFNLRINNSGDYNNGTGSKIVLNHNIEVINRLRLDQGVIEYTDRTTNRLYLMNRAANSLIYLSGRIIGKFERGINSTENYLFPLGSSEHYNPLNLKPNVLTSEGSVLSDFLRPNDLLDTGLPLVDSFAVDTSEIYETFPEGYWSLKANGGFQVADYNIDMDGAGFTNVQPITRLLKQDATAGVWEVDGMHADTDGTVAKRENLEDGIPGNGNHYAFGRARPYIKEQPVNDTVCELGTDGNFKVRASGRGWFNKLEYQWQVSKDGGNNWETLDESHPDYDNYQGTDEKELLINVAYYSMNQYQYRVIVTDKHDNDKISDPATLVVEPLPTAIATPADELLCNDETTEIFVTSDLNLPGTTYILEVLNSATTSITGASGDSFFGDTVIRQTLNNPGSNIDSVIYRIVPYGPYKRFCEGWADTVTIRVNPTPDIDLVVPDSVICNEGTTDFSISTLNTRIGGDWYYDLTVTPDAGISGAKADGRYNDLTFTEVLTNNTSIVQKVVYHFHPVIEPADGEAACENGGPNDTTIVIWVNPTPDIVISVSDTVSCNEGTTTVTVTTPNVTIRGDWYYDISVTEMETGISSADASLDDRRIGQGPLELLLTNNTPHVKTVVFNFHPVIEPDDGGEDCENGVPNDTAITIYVNPTPVLLISVPLSVTNEQIYCNGADVAFSIVNNQQTAGTIRYDLEVTDENAVFSGNTLSGTGRTVENFTDNPIHYQDTISGLNYRFIPYIEGLTGNPTCYRIDNRQNFEIEVVPVLSAIESPNVLPLGFNITCHGLSDGEILLTPTGGDLRYTYEIYWENESGDSLQTEQADYGSIEELSAGIYEYSVTDTLGCFFSNTIVLTEPDTLAIDSYDIISPQCYGDDPSGGVDIVLSGGVKSGTDYKDYEWRHALIDEIVGIRDTLTGVISGPFKFTFKDHYNCSFDTLFIIPPANRLDSETLGISEYGNFQISCNGASDGSVEVIGLGGAGSDTGTDTYTYKWYDEDKTLISNTSYIENMPAGTYYYWLSDANGCLLGAGLGGDSLISIDLTEPEPIAFLRDSDDLYPGDWDISCFGRSDGKINLQYFGGHTEYMDNAYNWSGDGDFNSTDSVLFGRSAGSYAVTVTDAIGCTDSVTFILQQPPQITYDTIMSGFAGLNNVSCFGRSDGFVNLENVSGGGTKETPGIFEYAWTPPAGVTLDDETHQDQDNLPAGRYFFTITDQIGCLVLDSAEITQPDSLYAVPDNFFRNGYEISCFEGSDGWVSLLPSGGTRPYSYDWSDEIGGDTATVIYGLVEGYYSVTITDPNGCENFYEWELQHPDTIVLNPDPSRLIECFGDTSTIRISPEGGVGGFTYQWDETVTSRDLTGATEGTYHVVVTDANGCVVSDSIYLGQRSRIMPEIFVRSDYNGRHISCYGAEDATIELVVSGGNDSNYTFEWNTLAGDNNKYTLSGLPAGIYTVNGEDASGCAFDTVKQVVQPSDINVMNTAKEPLCEGNENGSISISVVGGTPISGSPIYNYSLNGEENLPAPEFENLPEGEYVIVVKDANNCTDTTEIVLVAPEALAFVYEKTPAECKDKADGTLTINFIDGGTMPYNINGGTSQYFDNLLPGDFVIEVIDGNGCRLIDTAFIEVLRLSCLNIPNAFTPNGDGANDEWILDDDENGVNNMYLYPDAELRIYNRWGELVYYSNNVADEPWDGTYNGRDLPVDSYHFVLDLGNGDAPENGNVTIIR